MAKNLLIIFATYIAAMLLVFTLVGLFGCQPSLISLPAGSVRVQQAPQAPDPELVKMCRDLREQYYVLEGELRNATKRDVASIAEALHKAGEALDRCHTEGAL